VYIDKPVMPMTMAQIEMLRTVAGSIGWVNNESFSHTILQKVTKPCRD